MLKPEPSFDAQAKNLSCRGSQGLLRCVYSNGYEALRSIKSPRAFLNDDRLILASFKIMISDSHHITILSSNMSKNISEISLSHKLINDLFGEVKTVFNKRNVATIYATIYEKGKLAFRETVDVEDSFCRVSGVPYKIAVSNAQNQLVAKLKKMMQEVALTREVDPDEQDSFTRMLENTCRAFPNLSREQGMHLVLDALKAKQRREPAATDDDVGFAPE